MNFKAGDFVTRDSHNNDIVFVILSIDKNIAVLKGHNVRLIANSPLSDLKICDDVERFDEFDVDFGDLKKENLLDRDDMDSYFFLPPRVLHLDGDP